MQIRGASRERHNTANATGEGRNNHNTERGRIPLRKSYGQTGSTDGQQCRGEVVPCVLIAARGILSLMGDVGFTRAVKMPVYPLSRRARDVPIPVMYTEDVQRMMRHKLRFGSRRASALYDTERMKLRVHRLSIDRISETNPILPSHHSLASLRRSL